MRCACVFMMMRSRRRKVTEKKQDIQKSPKSLINLYSSVSVGSLISLFSIFVIKAPNKVGNIL